VATCMAWCVMRLHMCLASKQRRRRHHSNHPRALQRALQTVTQAPDPQPRNQQHPETPGKPTKPGDPLVPLCAFMKAVSLHVCGPLQQRRHRFLKASSLRKPQRIRSPVTPGNLSPQKPFFPSLVPVVVVALSLSRHVWFVHSNGRRTETDSCRREPARLSLLSNNPSNTAATQPGPCICVAAVLCVASDSSRHFHYPFWQVA
jgi:hypothetical protein